MCNTGIKIQTSIKCILFDLDNTLVGIPNTWHYFDGLIQSVMEEVYHLPIPAMEKRNTLWRSGKEYVEILKGWGVTDPDDFWVQFDHLDSIKRQDLIDNDELVLYDDVIPTLMKLKAMTTLRLGIVTNTPIFIAQKELETFHLHLYFDEILGLGDHQEICKPEPDGILQVLEKMGCLPPQTLFIGDSSIDLLAAKNARAIPILIDRTDSKAHGFPDIPQNDYFRIKNMDEIWQFLS